MNMDLQAARLAQSAAATEVQRIRTAMDALALVDMNAIAKEVTLAADDLAQLRAAVVLGEAVPSQVQAAEKRLAAAQKVQDAAQHDHDNHSATLLGLERRLASAQAHEAAATQTLQDMERELLQAELLRLDSDYTTKALELATLAGRLHGTARALAARGGNVPAATASALQFPPLPVLGPAGAEVIKNNTNGQQHGIRAMLAEPRYFVADPAQIAAQVLA